MRNLKLITLIFIFLISINFCFAQGGSGKKNCAMGNLLKEMKDNEALSDAVKGDLNFVDVWTKLDDAGIDKSLLKNPNSVKNLDRILNGDLSSKIKIIDDGGFIVKEFEPNDLKELLDDALHIDDTKKMVEYMLPKSEDLKMVIGGVEEFHGLAYRYYPEPSDFLNKSGNLKDGIIPADWSDASKYKELLEPGTTYKAGLDFMRKNLDSKPNLAFGIGAQDLSGFAKNKKAWQYGNDFELRGLSSGGDFTKEFVQVVMNVRSNGGKIYFNLDGVDPSKIKLLDNPNVIDGDNFTNFEIRNLSRNKDWFENTEWFENGNKLSPSELKDKFGIEPLFE